MNLVLGIGLTSTATVDDVSELVDSALDEIDGGRADVVCVATLASRASHVALAALDRPVVAFSAEQLAAQAAPHRSGRLMTRIATSSVAEAAALLASGSDQLIVERRASRRVVIAIAIALDEIATVEGLS